MPTFNSTLLIRLDEVMRRAIDAAAADDGRTSSAYVRKVMLDHLREAGYLKDSNQAKPKRPRRK